MRMDCKNVPKGSGGPGALLWGLSLGDNPSMVLLLISSGPEQAPWMLGVAERLPATQHPGLERGSQSRAESPAPGTSQWAPNWRDAATPCTGEKPDLEGCRDKVQTLFPLNQKCLYKPV